MNTTEKTIETLFNKVEVYSKTSVELLKLNAIDKTAELVSILLTQMILFFVGMVFIFFSSIGVAFWLDVYFNSTAISFSIVAGFYLAVTLVFFAARNAIKVATYKLISSNLTQK